MMTRIAPPIGSSPGDFLVSAYFALLDSPRWRAHGGHDFVFFDPHPGFASGIAAMPYVELLCGSGALGPGLSPALHVLAEHRVKCPWNARVPSMGNYLIAPYVGNAPDLRIPQAPWQDPPVEPATRSRLIYFKGKCRPYNVTPEGHVSVLSSQAVCSKILPLATTISLHNKDHYSILIHCHEQSTRVGHPSLLL